MKSATALATLGLLAWAASAAAQASKESVPEGGGGFPLIGSWAVTCAGPYSNSNPLYIYVERGGSVMLNRDYGDGRTDSNQISAIGTTADGNTQYTVHFATVQPPQFRRHVISRHPDGQRLRVVSNHNPETGVYSIQNGKYVPEGGDTVWMYRCR